MASAQTAGQWLRERIQDERKTAEACGSQGEGLNWQTSDRGYEEYDATVIAPHTPEQIAAWAHLPPTDGSRIIVTDPHIAPHIALWDPARVLRECDTKLRILDWLERTADWAIDNNMWTYSGDVALKMFAQPYRDLPGFPDELRTT